MCHTSILYISCSTSKVPRRRSNLKQSKLSEKLNKTIFPKGQCEGYQTSMCSNGGHVEKMQCVGDEDCGEWVEPSVLFVLSILANTPMESHIKLQKNIKNL